MGFYCPAGADTPTACPIGTFSSATGNQKITDCTQCGAGKFCSSRGMTHEGTDCSAGYYCPAGVPLSTSTPTNYVCQEGYMCPAGVQAPMPCNPGFYQPYKMQALCLTCPASYYCPIQSMSAAALCPAGQYCPAGSINPVDCPAGTYNPFTGLSSASHCLPCPSGRYCQAAG